MTPTRTKVAIPHVTSPRPGTVLELHVKENSIIKKNEPICVIEAMKMQNIIKSPHSGLVKKIFVKKGEQIHADQILLEFKEYS
jgi:biotin carboxyl carrier protein